MLLTTCEDPKLPVVLVHEVEMLQKRLEEGRERLQQFRTAFGKHVF